jgi:prophage maintenance system killer protein
MNKFPISNYEKKIALGFTWISPSCFFLPKAADIEEAVFAFKRSIPIHAARTLNTLERLGVTDEKAKVIIEYGKGVDMPLHNIRTIENYGQACNFLFDQLRNKNWQLNKESLCALHSILARDEVKNPGEFRKIPVRIEGSVYMPPQAEGLQRIYDAGMDMLTHADISIPEYAMATFLFLSRTQLFEDANKRTAALSMNAILLDNGYKPLNIDCPPLDFLHKMTDFYETADATQMMADLNNMAQEQYQDIERNKEMIEEYFIKKPKRRHDKNDRGR